MISTIVPTYNLSLDLLKQNIESIFAYTDQSRFELIVVSNGQSEEVNQYLRGLTDIRLLEYPTPLGYASATNKGIRIARSDYILLLNDDCQLLPQKQNIWIDRLLEPFRDPAVGIVGTHLRYNSELQFEFVIFCCAVIHRKVIQSVGLLDEGFTIGGCEDIDYCYRAIRAGYKMVGIAEVKDVDGNKVTTDFPLYHIGGATMNTIQESNEQFSKNLQRLVYKHRMDTERFILNKGTEIPAPDILRWQWFKGLLEDFIHKTNRKPTVLEIGCGTGYGLPLIEEYLSFYLGLDKDANVVKFATIDYGSDTLHFQQCDYQDIIDGKVVLDKKYDFVICFEVLEHLDNFDLGLQTLFQLGDNVVVTVPYNEPPGFWGPYHKHWHLKEDRFIFNHKKPLFVYQTFDNKILYNKLNHFIRNLYVYYPSQLNRPSLLVYISTKDRYFSTLPLTLISIAEQTVPPNKLLILDDGEHLDLRQYYIYQSIFGLLREKGIEWEVIFTPQQGQVKNHQWVNRELGKEYDWVWRIDDDEYAEPKIIERFFELVELYQGEKIGAIGFSTRLPGTGEKILDVDCLDKYYAIKVRDLVLPNIQYSWGDKIVEVEHLYSTFFYKPNIVDYNTDLSIVGHTEETQFTYDLHLAGYKILVDLSHTIYHYQNLQGGIRSYNQGELWSSDGQKFLSKYSYNFTKFFLICNPNSLGDNLVMAKVIQDNIELFGDAVPLIATGHREAYRWSPCKAMPLHYQWVFRKLSNNIAPQEDNIYRYMAIKNKGYNLYQAYLNFIKDKLETEWQRRLISGI